MESSCLSCNGRISALKTTTTTTTAAFNNHRFTSTISFFTSIINTTSTRRITTSTSTRNNNNHLLSSKALHPITTTTTNSNTGLKHPSTTPKKQTSTKRTSTNNNNNLNSNTTTTTTPEINLRSSLYQNGDPLGRRDLGKLVVKWISLGMKAMATDFALSEVRGDFSEEVTQRMGPGLTFVIQAQPYLTAVPMPLGLEAVCLKACTHYPTLFDHFQRELREVLIDLHNKSLVQTWSETLSWKLLKDLAHSAQHRAIARKAFQAAKAVHHGLGMDMGKANAIQNNIDEFTNLMSELLRIERDSELEFTQEELNAVPTPDLDSAKPIEFLVSHSQAEQELCDTICNLNAVSTSTG